MPIHSANPLGSDDASFEYGVCFCAIRRRVRYWASTLADNDKQESNFMGALLALRALCDMAPRSCKGHIAVDEVDEWQQAFEGWVDRCQKKIARRKVSVDELKSNAAEVFDQLRAFGMKVPRAMWEGEMKKDLASIKKSPIA